MDAQGVNHHRLYPMPETILRPFSKTENSIIKTNSTAPGVRMPIIGGSHEGNFNRASSHKGHPSLTQPVLPTIESVLRERSIILGGETGPQLNAMDRVHQILKQLYVPNEKK